MIAKNLADKDKPYSLSARLCGEEGAEKLLLYIFAYSFAIVGDDDACWAAACGDGNIPVAAYALDRVFYYVHKYLLE